MIFVKWQRIQVPKDAPVRQVANQADQFGSALLDDLILGVLDVLICQVGLGCDQGQIGFGIFGLE